MLSSQAGGRSSKRSWLHTVDIANLNVAQKCELLIGTVTNPVTEHRALLLCSLACSLALLAEQTERQLFADSAQYIAAIW